MAGKPPASDPVQDAPQVSQPQHSAVGLPAITHALRISQQQMGVRRTALTLLRVNQRDGFDCPGCAWPEPDKPHTAEFCENGAKAVAEEATLRRVTPDFFADHSVADLATRSGYWLGQQGRLTHPMYLPEGADHYEPVTWERAFDIVGEELTALGSPDEAVFYTSGRTSNEAAFLYQLFAREFGTNNLPDCSNMCHESSGSALTETIGIGKGSVLLEDLYQADLIIIAGQNPGTNHPRMLTALEKAKAGGTKIISINPLPEAGLERFKNPQTPRGLAGGGTALTDLFLQVRLGGDQALFRALNRLLLDTDGALDEDFIRTHTHGFEEFAQQARADDDWDATLRATGLTRAEIDRALAMILDSRRTIVCWAMGLTQHKHSVPTIQEVVNFLLLRGNIGRPGAGVCPVRGHSNVQGDRTMGIFERPAPAFLDALEKEFGFAPPREHGLDVVRAIRALRDGQAKVFFAMGGNFVAATPDTDVTEAAMRRARLTVHVSTKLNRSHAVTGARALILPTLGRTERDVQTGPDGKRTEQFVTVEDSMGMVHASRGRLAPASPQLLSETAIVARLARRVLGEESHTPWEEFEKDYATIRDRIARVIPGFEDFNTKIARPGGFALPHAPRDSRSFPTATGKANFTAAPVTCPTVPEGRLLLQTLRSHDQYNTTIYGLDDRYRGIKNGRRVVLVHPDDARERGLADGAYTDLVSEWTDGSERRAPGFRVVHYPTARGCAAAYYPETNVLIPLDHTADTSNTPAAKSLVIRLESPRED
ncbi:MULTISPECIES: FdhF/YdeP family oxidoreductase [unclassified Streptomyces]|uniref:FdhF/YdeP family oxidoreductase n=1 Tax=unclassified Streptomyces TaxID=2593676 RepID=UPI000883179D|nr:MULTISPECIES: FdhF/YdeP family oxidoreductase [unclassified Streptomyces]PBC81812.1 molybdopterin-dependent oxidoreductase alpha subunit [Streptomyces sp. 2321.6]SDR52999.1 oxidoreductase alpha (molybdopterin) subunit [Streptomyces sp. KS_16]SEC31617.1 oxidoreductase alpha (molybdopterin) subunit [Streptomyces sp. 2133.1]SEF04950.1 oxidoreductase alpha (molybdopterin) subunit [Streptomyces sp. 2112.3]SNC66576.1 oxidoreductase alpha (molybdopterin) subunit [Streptomyces sp. 2114.4]